MAMLGRFCITIAMNAGIQYTVELVPTQLRGRYLYLSRIPHLVPGMPCIRGNERNERLNSNSVRIWIHELNGCVKQ